MHIYVIVMQINIDIVMEIPAPLTLISTCFLGRTLLCSNYILNRFGKIYKVLGEET